MTVIQRIQNKDMALITDKQEIANEINDYFSNVEAELASSVVENSTPNIIKRHCNITMAIREVSRGKILEYLSDLQVHKAMGMDGVNNTVLKQ